MIETARRHVYFGLWLLMLGMGLGIYMGISGNHAYAGAHAHINLVGGLLSLVYAVILRIWVPEGASPKLIPFQQFVHWLGTLGLGGGLFLMMGGHAPLAILTPVLAISAILVFCALFMMFMIFANQQPSMI